MTERARLEELLKNVRPATQEELRQQGENLAKNYKPGPRQAIPFIPTERAAVPETDLERGFMKLQNDEDYEAKWMDDEN